MNVETCKVGPILTNCYIVEDDGRVMVIDPGDALTMIVADIHARPVEQIVVTHAHWDHIGALSGLAEVTGAPVAMSAVDAALVDGVTSQGGHDLDRGHGAPHVDRLLHDGDKVALGSSTFTVIETPGHSEGSICLYCADAGVLFSGDTLFSDGRFGRTDFEHGSMEKICARKARRSRQFLNARQVSPCAPPRFVYNSVLRMCADSSVAQRQSPRLLTELL